ncbi:FAD:protein FMN transferase [Demequina salsinemoris]|uniref:FAD:protein FMN transferase n=1 Tax=Demequina salsinemoris TaxID=577470 RepID=UPI0007816576|nr:FAD:protein FMN transferase [Demequina salsinemoris]
MGTLATLCFPGPADPTVTEAVARTLRGLERRLTVNGPPSARAASQVEAINAAAGRAAVEVDPEVYGLVRTAVIASREHRDSFNALIGPVVKAWGIGFDGAHVPDDAAIAALLSLTDPEEVEMDDARSTVRLGRPGMRLDLGAIAKGYAADRAADVCREHGVEGGLIDLGGNVVAMGRSDVGVPWQVGIQSPFDVRGEVLGTVSAQDESVVTSGVYERVLEVGGKRYHHMIDPLTGRPFQTDLASVTVVAASSTKADLWATIAQAGGLDEGFRRVSEAYGVEAVFITHDGSIVATPGLEARLTLRSA